MMIEFPYHPEPEPSLIRLPKSHGKRILDPVSAARLIADGWAAADLHVHTWYSNDVIPSPQTDPLTLYRSAIKKGFRFVTFTDHDTMDAYDRIGWTRERVVPGVEIRILDPVRVGHTLHVNVYGLDKKQFLEIEAIAQRERNIDHLVRYLVDSGLSFIYNHPFWCELHEKLSIQSIRDIAPLFPVLEYNRGRIHPLNREALELADELGLGLAAGSDTHSGLIGSSYTLAQAATFPDFFDELRRGRSLAMPQDMNVELFSQEICRFINFIFGERVGEAEIPGVEQGRDYRFFRRLVQFLIESDMQKGFVRKKIIRSAFSLVNALGIPAYIHLSYQRRVVDEILRFATES
jgi:predicted metal-dependent phosphoesterase TrpH